MAKERLSRKKGKLRTPSQRAKDLSVVANLMIRKHTAAEIRVALNEQNPYTLSASQVARDIDTVHRVWRESRQQDIEQIREAELKGLDHQEAELWAEWQRSKAARESETTSVEKAMVEGVTSSGGKVKKTTHKEQGFGDVAYQTAILGVRDRRAKLLGMDAPQKTELEVSGAESLMAGVEAALERAYGNLGADTKGT